MTPAQPFSLRNAELRDVGAIVQLIRDLAEFEQLTHLLQVTPEKLRPQLFGERPAAEAVIAEIGGEAVGYALFFPTFSTFLGRPGLWLEDLFVLPERRGGGVGRALLTHVAQMAVARECGRLEWSALDWNEPALAFYRGLGASVKPEWHLHRLDGAALAAVARSST